MSLDAMKQALSAIEFADMYIKEIVTGSTNRIVAEEFLRESAKTLRAAIEQAQEPVAWMHKHIENNVITHRPSDLDRHPDRWVALYNTPPPCPTCEALARTVMMDQTSHDTAPRQWQGLTDDEIDKVMPYCHNEFDLNEFREFARAIEAKLKEKNT